MTSAEVILILAGITVAVLALVGAGAGWVMLFMSAGDAVVRHGSRSDADD